MNECFEWRGASVSSGYGAKSIGGKMYRTSRLAMAWALWDGTGDWKDSIPDGMSVLHKCDNPACCNPDHLYVGTPMDNMRDKHDRGRHRYCRGEELPYSKLTDAAVLEIRSTPFHRGSGNALAEKFGVSPGTISQVRHGKWWNHVGD